MDTRVLCCKHRQHKPEPGYVKVILQVIIGYLQCKSEILKLQGDQHTKHTLQLSAANNGGRKKSAAAAATLVLNTKQPYVTLM